MPVPVPRHQKIAVLVGGNQERTAIRTSKADLVAGLGVAQVVGGFAGILFTGDFVDVETAAYQQFKFDAVTIGRFFRIGDGVVAMVRLVAVGMRTRGQHADVLAFQKIKSRSIDTQNNAPDLIAGIGCDTFTGMNNGFGGVAGAEVRFEFGHDIESRWLSTGRRMGLLA